MTSTANVTEDVPQEAPGSDVDACGRLVEEHHIRRSEDGESRRQLPLVASTEVLGEAMLMRLQAHSLDHGVNSVLDILASDTADAGVEGEHLACRELVWQSVELRAVAQVLACLVAVVGDAPATKPHIADAWIQVSRDHAHCCGLSCSVDTKQAEALAARDAHVDATDRMDKLLAAAAAESSLQHESLAQVLDEEPVALLGLLVDFGVRLSDALRLSQNGWVLAIDLGRKQCRLLAVA
mmetsp:Transcript_40290/g.94731  ORF Transcript_40290/g.94731 Transcript_40290/m.94731 type:complete len:238 (-) Transcript_40290:5334-6047(-)